MKKDELRFEALKLALTRHDQATELPIVFQTADKFLAYINHTIPTSSPAHEAAYLTEEQITELFLLSENVVEFAKRTKLITVDHGLVPFKPFAHQEHLLRSIETDQYVVVTAARQMGTTTAVVVSVLHELLFKPDQTVLIVAPSLANAMEFLDRLKLAYESLPAYLVPGKVEYSKSCVSFDNGSRIIVRAAGRDAGRGLGITTLVIQDAAWLSHSVGREFFDGIYPCLAVGSGRNRCIVYSAAHDTDGMFYDLNQSAEKNGFARISIPWQHHPERDDAWAAATRAVIGKADFARQFECKFVSLDKVKKGR